MPKDMNEKSANAAAKADLAALPLAVDDALTVTEDAAGPSAQVIPVSVLLANDKGGKAKSLVSVESLGEGSVSLGADGQTLLYDTKGAFDYLAVGEATIDTFEYTIQLGNGVFRTATVTVTVTGMNDGPQAVSNAYTLKEDTILAIPAGTGLLANDSDIEGDVLRATVETDVQHGTLVVNPDGSFSYTPDSNFHGADSFIYTVTDEFGATDTATVSLTVEDASAITNISNGGTGRSFFSSASADGSKGIFEVASDVNAPWTRDTFVYDLTTGEATILAENANNWLQDLTISADGSTVAFKSFADNIVDFEGYYGFGTSHVYTYDVATGAFVAVTYGGIHVSFGPMLSADGSTVVFTSQASNLAEDNNDDPYWQGDLNGKVPDAFIHDRETGKTINITDRRGYDWSHWAEGMSDDGSKILYVATTSEYVVYEHDNRIEERDLYVYDAKTGEAAKVVDTARDIYDSTGTHLLDRAISADGSTVFYTIGEGSSTQQFVFDTETGESTKISEGLSGGGMSADGSKIILTDARGLYIGNVTHPYAVAGDVFVFDTETDETISITRGSNGGIVGPKISADGTKVAFSSNATNLVEGQVDLNGDVADVFIFNMKSGEVTNITDGGNGASEVQSISSDGTRVTFTSHASNLVEGEIDTNGNGLDVFVFEI
nr:Ig-like domain-containing protein [Paracoccus saliphilus]